MRVPSETSARIVGSKKLPGPAIGFPVVTEPVKLILRGTGWEVIQAPRSSPPETTLRTPGGKTSRSSSPIFRVVRGVNGDGFSTRVLPAARAGAIFQLASVIGK